MDGVFDYKKVGFLSDTEIEAIYAKKSKSINDKSIQQKLFRASIYDPRKSDVYFGSQECALKAEKIADKLNRMPEAVFLSSSYPYKWFDELEGETIFKIVNKKILKSSYQ